MPRKIKVTIAGNDLSLSVSQLESNLGCHCGTLTGMYVDPPRHASHAPALWDDLLKRGCRWASDDNWFNFNSREYWEPEILADVQRQLYSKYVRSLEQNNHLFYVMSDNVNTHDLAFKVSDCIEYFMKEGWACWASPLGNNPNHRSATKLTFVQVWIVLPPKQFEWVAHGTDFSFVPPGVSTENQLIEKFRTLAAKDGKKGKGFEPEVSGLLQGLSMFDHLLKKQAA